MQSREREKNVQWRLRALVCATICQFNYEISTRHLMVFNELFFLLLLFASLCTRSIAISLQSVDHVAKRWLLIDLFTHNKFDDMYWWFQGNHISSIKCLFTHVFLSMPSRARSSVQKKKIQILKFICSSSLRSRINSFREFQVIGDSLSRASSIESDTTSWLLFVVYIKNVVVMSRKNREISSHHIVMMCKQYTHTIISNIENF